MKNWLHFMLHEDGRSMYEDDAGGISSTVVPTALKNTPDGWKDISIGYQRDMKRIGIIKSFTFPLLFVRDGAKIARNMIYKYGVEFKIFYLITKRKVEFLVSSFKDYHTKFYRGELDLSAFNDDDDKITIPVGPLGLEKELNAKDSTEYEFPLSDPAAENIMLDGMNLYSTVIFDAPPEAPWSGLFQVNHAMPFGDVLKTGETYGVAVFSQVIQSAGNTDSDTINYLKASQNFFLTVDVLSPAVTMSIKGKLIVKMSNTLVRQGAEFPRLRINVMSSFPNGGTHMKIAYSSEIYFNGQEAVYPFDYVITVQPGEHIFLIGKVHFAGNALSPLTYEFLPDSEVEVFFGNRYKKTFIRGFKPAVLLDKIIEKIYGKKNYSSSALLTSNPFQNLFITSGDGLRGIENAVVKISFDKFFDTYSVPTFGGCSIENDKLVFESVTRYFNNSLPAISLGVVKYCKVSALKEFIGNQIEIGWMDRDIEGVNGKSRFNTLHKYSTPATRTKEKINLKSAAFSDPFIIEYERVNFSGKTTTDSKGDNELYLLNLKPDTAAFLESIASLNSPESFANGTEIAFPNFNNVVLVTDGSFKKFTYYGATTTASIKVYNLALSSPPGENVTISLRINNVQIASSVVAANGTTAHSITIGRQLVSGDIISVIVSKSPVGDTQILSATLNVEFVNFPVYSLFRETYDVLEGVPDDTVFNIESMTPKRLLILWKKWLNSIAYKLDGQKYVYQTSERNSELLTVKGTVRYDEDADEEIGTDILFKPIVFEIETMIPVDLVDQLDIFPTRPFEFEHEGELYKGFLLKAGIAPDDNRSQVFKLLCTPDTDETKLIK